MLKLRTLLLSNKPYYIFLLVTIIITVIRILIPNHSQYIKVPSQIKATIISITITNEKVALTVLAKEKIKVTYYLKNNEKINYQLGDKVEIIGTLERPSNATSNYLFNYRKYLENNNIFYIMKANHITLIKRNTNVYYTIKNKIIKRLNNNPYLLTFIIGDKSKLSKNVTTSYRQNGISHLFSISGMHITVLSSIILNILKKLKLKENNRYFITSLFLLLYLSLTGLSPSILRSVLFFILFSINKIYYFYIKPTNLYLMTLSIALLINENYIYDIGFCYSYAISFSVIVMSSYLKGKYLSSLLKTSFISFLASLPISLYNFYEINLLSIIYNLFFVPLVSIIIFPLALITFILPITLPLFNLMIYILENTSLFLSKTLSLTINFPRLCFFIYLVYALLIALFFKGLTTNKKSYSLPLFILLILHFLYPYYISEDYIKILDVSQGDSTLIHVANKTVLIDSGGTITYKTKSPSLVPDNVTIPTLKSLGIRKIDYLITTHGDYDHMGEAKNIVNNIKVENVIFNCGSYNNLEKSLIKHLKSKNISYYSCIKELNLSSYKLQFLTTKVYDNENDNSNVIYLKYNNYKFLFMGDAGIDKEKDILEKYNLKDIDVLKVGHHGSNTSSSKEFIDKINPKYSIISVGKNNRYGHPNKEVLNNLSDSKIYRTDQDGSIMFKIKNNKLKIETCSP